MLVCGAKDLSDTWHIGLQTAECIAYLTVVEVGTIAVVFVGTATPTTALMRFFCVLRVANLKLIPL